MSPKRKMASKARRSCLSWTPEGSSSASRTSSYAASKGKSGSLARKKAIDRPREAARKKHRALQRSFEASLSVLRPPVRQQLTYQQRESNSYFARPRAASILPLLLFLLHSPTSPVSDLIKTGKDVCLRLCRLLPTKTHNSISLRRSLSSNR